MKIRNERSLPEDVYKTLKESPMYWSRHSVRRLKSSFLTPRNVEAVDPSRPRIFVTGHMIDQDPKKNRFPDRPVNILQVRSALWRELDELYARNPRKGIELVMCSATAGTDLLAMEWAMIRMDEMQNRGKRPNISMDINLPFHEKAFLQEAVTHASEKNYPWLAIYNHAKELGYIHEPKWKLKFDNLRRGIVPFTRVKKDRLNRVYAKHHKPNWQSFVDLNMHMTSRLRKGDYMVAVWDGKGGITPGGTQHGLTMSEPIITVDNIFILQNGIQQLGSSQEYGKFARRITRPSGNSSNFATLHDNAMSRWTHNSASPGDR